MITLLLILAVGSIFVLVPYLKNKQANREFDRRDRLQEKREELLKSLRTKKEADEKEKNIE